MPSRNTRALVEAFPADSTGLANLALAQFYQRNMTEALTQLRKAVAIFPMNVQRRTNLSLVAMYAGQFDAAISESEEVLKLNPSFAKAFVARALSEVALGRPADGVKTFEKLKGLSPAGASFAASGLADIALYQGRTGDALKLLDAGIAADTEAKNTTGVAVKRVARGDALLARGDSAGAAREAEQALARAAIHRGVADRRPGAGAGRPGGGGPEAGRRTGQQARSRPAGLCAADPGRGEPGAGAGSRGRGACARGAEAGGFVAGPRHPGARLSRPGCLCRSVV